MSVSIVGIVLMVAAVAFVLLGIGFLVVWAMGGFKNDKSD